MTNKLIILTDLGSFKAYRVTPDEMTQKPRIQMIDNFETIDGHTRIQDMVTDQAGRFPVANGIASGQMSHGENHNLRTEIEKRVIRQLADSINKLVTREDLPVWYFAAHREIDQRILENVDAAVKAKMRKHVRSDLTKVDKSELLGFFA